MKALYKSSKPHQPGSAGFTLIELSVIVLVIGLIAVVSIPSFRQVTERSKVDGAAQELIMDIQFARSIAVSRRQTYEIQFQADRYQIIEVNSGTIMREKEFPSRVAIVASANPRFRAWGMTDPTNFTVTGTHNTRILTLLPTGNVRRQ